MRVGTALALLAVRLGRLSGKLDVEGGRRWLKALRELPSKVEKAIDRAEQFGARDARERVVAAVTLRVLVGHVVAERAVFVLAVAHRDEELPEQR